MSTAEAEGTPHKPAESQSNFAPRVGTSVGSGDAIVGAVAITAITRPHHQCEEVHETGSGGQSRMPTK